MNEHLTVDRNAMRHHIWRCSTLLVVTLVCLPAGEAAERHHFVPGYDRFFRETSEDLLTGGELLVSELSCTACHAAAEASVREEDGTGPAFPKRGPVLAAAGSRLQTDWVKRFLADPQKAKPGTTMPDLLHGLSADQRRETIDALAAYLSSLKKRFPEVKSTATRPVALQFWLKGDAGRGGLLYHRVGCVACHAPDAEYDAPSKSSSQLDALIAQLEPEELEEIGLSNLAKPVRPVPLGDLSAKYTHQSLTYFLLDPSAVRPGGRMPGLKLTPHEAADIVAYLVGEQPGHTPPVANPPAALVEKGRELFHSLRCVNCHSVPNSDATAMAKPLAELDLKSPRACTAGPRAIAPRYSLDEQQRESLLAATGGWLGAAAPISSAPGSGSSERTPRGEALGERLGTENVENLSPARQVHLQMLQLNCYGCHERGGVGGVGPNLRGYFETVGQIDVGDEGRIPPALDDVGRKLKVSWLKRVLAGTGDVRPFMQARMPIYPESAVGDLPRAFVRADRHGGLAGSSRSDLLRTPERKLRTNPARGRGARNAPDPDLFQDSAALAGAGRNLMDTGCVQCHSVRGEHLPGVLGVDVADIAGRIQPDWFRQFLLNPVELKPRTRMPTFFPDGRSANREVLEGDVERQIAAIWGYLNDSKQPLPQKIEESSSHDFELAPEMRPVVLRTFMEEAGTHAIAVGFPQRVHLAFDAEQVRVAELWRGRFLDAHGTWFDRFAPPAVPLGTDRLPFPTGPEFALLETGDQQWPGEEAATFLGYRLDAGGIPTFLYRLGDFEIEDRFEPVETAEGALLGRRLRIVPGDGERSRTGRLWFRANSGREVVQTDEERTTNDAGLTVRLAGETGRNALLRTSEGPPRAVGRELPLRSPSHPGAEAPNEPREGPPRAVGRELPLRSPSHLGAEAPNEPREGRSEWILPLEGNAERTIEVTYQW